MIKFVAYQSDRLVGSDFTTDISFTTYSEWTVSSNPSPATTDCGSYGKIFGGYGKFGQSVQVAKTYCWTNTAHYELLANINFLKIDSWDDDSSPKDSVKVYVGSALQQTIISKNEDGPNNQCGGSSSSWVTGSIPYNEKLFALSYTISSHTTSSIEIKFVSSFDEGLSNESWGIRDVYIHLKMCDTTCSSCSGPASNQCTACQTNGLLSSGTCTYTRDYYYYKDATLPCSSDPCSSCYRCHINCKTCDGSSRSNCLSCESDDTYSNSAKTCTYPSSNNSKLIDLLKVLITVFINFKNKLLSRCLYSSSRIHRRYLCGN
jgi:hypothetical protein